MFGTGIGVKLKKWLFEDLQNLNSTTYELRQLRAEVAEIKNHVFNVDVFDYRNIYKHSHRAGSESSARYWEANMQGVRGFSHRDHLIAHACESISIEGQRLEFGVYMGGSISWMGRTYPQYTWHGFDSFEGLPESWSFNDKAAFDVGGVIPEVPSNVILHKGWYNETAPAFFKDNNEPIAFMHMDADLYSSTKTVFDCCWHLIRPGTVIQFDEYWNYNDWQNHEYKAFQEMVAERGMAYEYLGFVYVGECVAVRITKVGS